MRKHQQQPHQPILYKVNAGGLQRLDETTGEPQGNAVPVPVLLSLAGTVLDRSGIRNAVALDVVQQDLRRLVVGYIVGAIYQAVAHPVLQRYPPLPSGIPGD